MPSGKKNARAKTSKAIPATRSTNSGNTSAVPDATVQSAAPSNERDGSRRVEDATVIHTPPKRRSKRINAGTGGVRDQLEAVGDAVMATPYQRTRARFTIPDDEPVNTMAPTPHRGNQRKKASKAPAKANADLVPITEDAAKESTRVAVPSREASQFGFKLKNPPQPVFVGSESLDAFERRQANTRHPPSPTRATQAQRPRGVVTSVKTTQIQSSQIGPLREPGKTFYKPRPDNDGSLSDLTPDPEDATPFSSVAESGARLIGHRPGDGEVLHPLGVNEEDQEMTHYDGDHDGGLSEDGDNDNHGVFSDHGVDSYGLYGGREDDNRGLYEDRENDNRGLYEDREVDSHGLYEDRREDDSRGFYEDNAADYDLREGVSGDQNTRGDNNRRPHGDNDTSRDLGGDDLAGQNVNREAINSMQPPPAPPVEKHSARIQASSNMRVPLAQPRVRPSNFTSQPQAFSQRRVIESTGQQSGVQSRAVSANSNASSRRRKELPRAKVRPTAPGGTKLSHHVGDERVGVKYDLLTRHYATNRRCRSPSPESLQNSRNSNGKPSSKRQRSALSADATNPDDVMDVSDGANNGDEVHYGTEGEEEDKNDGGQKKGGRYSKHSKGSVPPKSTNISFYPENWRKVLDMAKARMRLHVAVSNGFPKIEHAVGRECQKALDEVLALFEENEWEVEADIYPHYKAPMCRLIFNDTHTFRSDIKKSVMKFIRPGYGLFPDATVEDEDERLALVMEKAGDLLLTSSYLRGGVDENGKTSNFAHRVFKEVVLDFFYNNMTKSLRQFPEFQDAVPYGALLLVIATVHSLLSMFRTYGFVDEKTVKLNSQNVQTAYNELAEQMEAVLDNEYHGDKLHSMLADWARTGMMGYNKKAKVTANTRKEFAVILD